MVILGDLKFLKVMITTPHEPLKQITYSDMFACFACHNRKTKQKQRKPLREWEQSEQQDRAFIKRGGNIPALDVDLCFPAVTVHFFSWERN